MFGRRKKKPGQYWQNCPVCGDCKRSLIRDVSKHVLVWNVRCGYCRFESKPAITKAGARKNWNKATNVVNANGREVRYHA